MTYGVQKAAVDTDLTESSLEEAFDALQAVDGFRPKSYQPYTLVVSDDDAFTAGRMVVKYPDLRVVLLPNELMAGWGGWFLSVHPGVGYWSPGA